MTTHDNQSQRVSEEEIKNLYVYVTKRKEGNISFCEYYPISKRQLVYKKDRMYFSISEDTEEYIHSLRSSLSQKQEECEKLRLFVQEFPEKLRSSLSGHKGEAYRIALQMCEEILPTTELCKSQ